LVEWHNKNSELRLKVGISGFCMHTYKIWDQGKVIFFWHAFWPRFWNKWIAAETAFINCLFLGLNSDTLPEADIM
jgi:hypothetical protein